MSVRLQIEVGTGINYSGGDLGTIELMAQEILVSHEGDIEGWINNLRQQRSIAPVGVMRQQLNFKDMTAEYDRYGKIENLTITAFPRLPPPSPESEPFAGSFDVKVPFQGYPVGQFEFEGWYAWGAWNLLDDGIVTNDDAPSAIPNPWGLPKVGVTGICKMPVSGLVYWEVQIKKLPTTVPGDLTLHYAKGVDDGTFLDCDLVDVNRLSATYHFPAVLDTWLTPAVGLLPSQLVPDGLTKNAVVDDVLVGMDKADTFNVARSVYVIPTTIARGSAQTKNWQAPTYEITNAVSLKSPGNSPSSPVAVQPVLLQPLLEIADVNPVLYANESPKPTNRMFQNTLPFDEPPQHTGFTRQDTSSLAVEGKYLIWCFNTLSSVPLNAIVSADVEAGLAIAVAQAKANADDNMLPYEDIFAGSGPVPFPLAAGIPYGGGSAFTWVLAADNTRPQYKNFIGWNAFHGGIAADDYIDVLSGQLQYASGKFVEAAFSNTILMGDYMNGPGGDYPDDSATVTVIPFNHDDEISYLYEGITGLGAPQGVNQVGTHTWGFKGRGDTLADTRTPTDDGPLIPPVLGDGVLFNSVWSGVDLGVLKEDDVLMFAVDGRKVFFGKNGKWFDKNGVSQDAPGSHSLLPSLLLDGDGTQDYYPAATLRVGPAEVNFLFGSSTKFAPPGGFKYYGNPQP